MVSPPGYCSNCKAYARKRTLRYLVTDILPKYINNKIVKSKPLLTFSAPSREIRELKKIFSNFKSTVYFWHKGWGDAEAGVDARDLSRYASNSFSGVFSMGTFQQFFEQEKAIQEAYRVISPGGIFITQFMPYHLGVDSEKNIPPIIVDRFHSTDTYYSHVPRNKEMISVKVGVDWFVKAMNKAGFKGHSVNVYDEITETTYTWFIGEKPINNS